MARAFRRGWGAPLLAILVLSSIGDEITLVALMFRVADAPSSVAVPALLLAELVPGLIAAPWIGRHVDRRDPAATLVAATLTQAAVLAFVAATEGAIPAIVGAGALGLLFAVSGAATFVLIPAVAQAFGQPLARANALAEAVGGVGMLAGPVAGGLLVAAGGVAAALLIDAATFAALALVLVGSDVRTRAPPPADAAGRTLAGDYLPLLADPRIAATLAALSLGVLASAIADVAFVFLATRTLGLGATGFGVLTACWAAGLLGGAALGGRIAARRPAALVFAGTATMGAGMLAIGLAPAIGTAAAAFVVGGAANGAHNVAMRTLLQQVAPAAALGRVAALTVAATRAATIAGFAAGGAFVPADAVSAYRVGGAIALAAGLGGWAALRVKRRLPA